MSRLVERLYVTARSSDFMSRLVERLYVTTRSSEFMLRLVATTLCYDQ
ncbi:hypothetical protein L1D59_01655 [Pseudoalteromonas piscicida]|nr:hypothetical protein [Pseudoalteromonas piscicida]MCG9767306.1 hypothetical protein [Pseudoalteromonas piscicida]